jgi:hypothetical protein
MFNIFGDAYKVNYEIYIGEQLVQKQSIEAPKEMLMINFIQNAQQIGNDKRPMKIRMVVPNTIWDNFDDKEIILNNKITFSNNAMVAWEKDNEQGETKND